MYHYLTIFRILYMIED